MKHLLFILTLFLSLNINSAEGAACGEYLADANSELGECEEYQADHSDKASLQRGAKIYFNYCYGCHSLKYSRYNRMAKDLEIPENLFEEYLLFKTSETFLNSCDFSIFFPLIQSVYSNSPP